MAGTHVWPMLCHVISTRLELPLEAELPNQKVKVTCQKLQLCNNNNNNLQVRQPMLGTYQARPILVLNANMH